MRINAIDSTRCGMQCRVVVVWWVSDDTRCSFFETNNFSSSICLAAYNSNCCLDSTIDAVADEDDAIADDANDVD
jgi:hypothetical protein